MAYSSNQFNSAILIKLTINYISMGGYMVELMVPVRSVSLSLSVSLSIALYYETVR